MFGEGQREPQRARQVGKHTLKRDPQRSLRRYLSLALSAKVQELPTKWL